MSEIYIRPIDKWCVHRTRMADGQIKWCAFQFLKSSSMRYFETWRQALGYALSSSDRPEHTMSEIAGGKA